MVSDLFAGVCPFHGDCVEGLAYGPAIAARAGRPAETLPPDHPVWGTFVADLAEFTALLMLVAAPDRIVTGGSVALGQLRLLPPLRDQTADRLADYLPGVDRAALDVMLVSAGLAADAGPLGTVALAHQALADSQSESGTTSAEHGPAVMQSSLV